MNRVEAREVGVLLAGEVLLAAVVGRWLLPSLPDSVAPHLWAAVGLFGLVVLGYAVVFLVQSIGDLAERRRWSARALADEQRQLDLLRRQLQRVHVLFRAEQLHDERDQVRRLAASLPDGPASRSAWQRLLALEGPRSAAWVGLARAFAASGAAAEAIRCQAEAVRHGHLAPADLLALGRELQPEGKDLVAALASAEPAATVGAAARILDGDLHWLPEVYAALAHPEAQPVVAGTLARELHRRLGDDEEAARQRERVEPPATDPVLRGWLTEAWAHYRRRPDGRGEVGWRGLDGDAAAVAIVPPDWRRPLGLEAAPRPAPPVYLDPLPMYAVPERDRLEALADEMIHHTNAAPESVFGQETAPEQLVTYLAARLWPRSVRSRMFIEDALRRLGSTGSARHVAAGLEILAAALWEEHGGGLDELRGEFELAVRRLPPGPFAARALHAVGYVWWPRDGRKAEAFWEESLREARRIDPLTARPVLARFVPTFVGLAERGEPSGAAMLLAADCAMDSASREALLTALRAALSASSPRLRQAVCERLTSAAGLMDHRGRFLLAWWRRDAAAIAGCLLRLWDEPDDPAPLTWCEAVRGVAVGAPRFGGAGHPWLWAAWALAGRASPGDEAALRTALNPLRERARKGNAAALAGWLLLACRLDELEARPSRPEARRALDLLVGLPAEALAEPLAALRCTLVEASPKWLEAVEIALLRRVRAEIRRPDPRLDQVGLRAVIGDLGPAHTRAQVAVWLEAYRHGLLAWRRDERG